MLLAGAGGFSRVGWWLDAVVGLHLFQALSTWPSEPIVLVDDSSDDRLLEATIPSIGLSSRSSNQVVSQLWVRESNFHERLVNRIWSTNTWSSNMHAPHNSFIP